MGDNNNPLEKKRKKKGRPSLLDLQRRSLRLQKQQHQQQPNPSPNPYLRFPNRTSPRRTPRRSPLPSAASASDDDSSSGKRREKKLRLVLRLPANPSSDPASSPSGSDADADPAPRHLPISAVAALDEGEKQGSEKGTGPHPQGEPSDLGPTTPLPDKKLLVFILDRLQKKDTYGVFSEPVNPNELPDYHDIIDHPMDFGTIRKKLDAGAYANLEQFEKDVFLISSNAMCYNAPDTIYYRQARAIQELAKKNFENLRQESDDNEPESKPVVRRGRPPSKKTIKRAVGKPPAERAAMDFSSAILANAGEGTHSSVNNDLSRKDADKLGMATRSGAYGLRNVGAFSLGNNKPDRSEEYLGSALRGNSMKYGKKVTVIDENRRNTYLQVQQPVSMFAYESPAFSAFGGERKLLPIGVLTEHAYARSLAQFGANLGPIGWEIAAKRIERSLPPGTKFGHGWVGDDEVPSQSQPIASSLPPPSPHPCISANASSPVVDRIQQRQATPPQRLETSPSSVPGHFSRNLPPAPAVMPNQVSDTMEVADPAVGSNSISSLNHLVGSGMWPKTPFQLHQNQGMQRGLNGFSNPMPHDTASRVTMVRPTTLQGPFGAEAPSMHAQAFNMISRSSNSFMPQVGPSSSHADGGRANELMSNPSMVMMNSNSERAKPMGNSSMVISSGGPWPQGLQQHHKQGSSQPDLNVRFQSPGSPSSGLLVDSQQPDLALQL